MPKINNVEFLTLPQQVNKNKKDIQANTSGIDSLNQAVQNITVGIANIPMLSGIIIAALGVPQSLSGTNKAILLDNLKNQAAIKDDNKTISWAIHIQVMGSLVGDSAFPSSLVDYDVNLSNITFAGADNNRFYRVRGFSRDFTFVIECNIDTSQDVWVYTLDPTITMSSILQPSVFYTVPSNIVGGVVAITNLSPAGQWVKFGDMVLAGSGLYSVTSVVGTNVNVTPITTYLAPTGTFSSTQVRYYANDNLLEDASKIKVNNMLSIEFNSNSVHNDNTLENQINILGLDFIPNYAITSTQVVSGGVTTYGTITGAITLKIRNSTANTIVITGIQAPTNIGSVALNLGALFAISNPSDINYAPSIYWKENSTMVFTFGNFAGDIRDKLNGISIDAGKAIYVLMKF